MEQEYICVFVKMNETLGVSCDELGNRIQDFLPNLKNAEDLGR
jgi:hypothetical protein